MPLKSLPLSVFGVPLLGVAGLVVCLWHPQISLQATAAAPEAEYLLTPSASLDKCMAIFLRAEAKNVAYSRRHATLEGQARAVAGYNIIARECTPAVFRTTHLPSAFTF